MVTIERKTWHKYVKNLKYTHMDLCIFIYIIYIYMYDLCICDIFNINMEKPNHHIKCNRYNHEEAINRFILPEITLLMKCTHCLERCVTNFDIDKKKPQNFYCL